MKSEVRELKTIDVQCADCRRIMTAKLSESVMESLCEPMSVLCEYCGINYTLVVQLIPPNKCKVSLLSKRYINPLLRAHDESSRRNN